MAKPAAGAGAWGNNGMRATSSIMAAGMTSGVHLGFFFFYSVGPPVLRPMVMGFYIIVDTNPMGGQTGGDANLDPAVIGSSVVVSDLCHLKQQAPHLFSK